ncbi:hypothetical protein E2C01_004275 [Portunus trituberculatus]|uniref:Transmembrane protein n=1 Tax=Portunus trituberculatus TaxID=210409 RepID=A0A5B7CQZ2_PORTR|nr:hypothetical protein [Portunus trituberculatus]
MMVSREEASFILSPSSTRRTSGRTLKDRRRTKVVAHLVNLEHLGEVRGGEVRERIVGVVQDRDEGLDDVAGVVEVAVTTAHSTQPQIKIRNIDRPSQHTTSFWCLPDTSAVRGYSSSSASNFSLRSLACFFLSRSSAYVIFFCAFFSCLFFLRCASVISPRLAILYLRMLEILACERPFFLAFFASLLPRFCWHGKENSENSKRSRII